MEIISFEKITLQDYPEKIAAICFTRGCPLLCPYCHNPSLVLPKYFEKGIENKKAEFMTYLTKRKTMLDGVVVSGGEPLMQKGMVEFLKEIKNLGLFVKLDTNGMYPRELKNLIQLNLVDYVALDYKGFKESFYRSTGGSQAKMRDNLYETWKQALEVILHGRVSYELRTTVVKEIHTVKEIQAMAQELHALVQEESPAWFLQTYENKAGVINEITKAESTLSSYSKEEMEEIKEKIARHIPNVSIR
jgi:pyruvate formate lyase activating enzyme